MVTAVFHKNGRCVVTIFLLLRFFPPFCRRRESSSSLSHHPSTSVFPWGGNPFAKNWDAQISQKAFRVYQFLCLFTRLLYNIERTWSLFSIFNVICWSHSIIVSHPNLLWSFENGSHSFCELLIWCMYTFLVSTTQWAPSLVVASNCVKIFENVYSRMSKRSILLIIQQ